MRATRTLSALVAALAVLVVVGVAYGVARSDAVPPAPVRPGTASTPTATPLGPPAAAPEPAKPAEVVAFMCSGTGPAWENRSADPSLAPGDCSYRTVTAGEPALVSGLPPGTAVARTP